MAKNPLLRLPNHRNVFIEVLSPERVESAPQESVTKSEFALWFALMIDYKKLWQGLDVSYVIEEHCAQTKKIKEMPVSAT